MYRKLSPSDLTFLWDECPCCFYEKVVGGQRRPSTPMPKVFGRIHSCMTEHFAGQRDILPELSGGVVIHGEKWVESQPIALPGRTTRPFIRGRFDTVIEFDDGTYGVVDFKTAETNPDYVAFYGRQLSAYAYALEHPGRGKLGLAPISRLGLICVEPREMLVVSGKLAYCGVPVWIEIPVDEASFLAFMDEVATVLDGSDPPDPSPSCSWCAYRMSA